MQAQEPIPALPPGPQGGNSLLQGGPPDLFEPIPAQNTPPEPAGAPAPDMIDLETQFQNFPQLDQQELLKPGRLVTAAQKRVALRKARTHAEADPEVQEAWNLAAESKTFAGWREAMTLYYQRLCKRMRTFSPKLRPEIDRLEINSIQSVINQPGNNQGILDSYQIPR